MVECNIALNIGWMDRCCELIKRMASNYNVGISGSFEANMGTIRLVGAFLYFVFDLPHIAHGIIYRFQVVYI